MRLGRWLGSLQDPVWVMDTSFLVKFGQHDYGAITQTMTARQETASHFAGQDKDKIYVQLMVLDRVGKEYKGFYDNHVPGDYGMPKASIDLLSELELTEFPQALSDMFGPAKSLWRTESKKAYARDYSKAQPSISKTDTEILAFTIEQAENRRPCWVFSYDEDITGPVKTLASKSNCVYLADESAQSADAVMKTIEAKHNPIFLPPRIAGEFYKTPTRLEAAHCLTTAKVPFAGGEEEFAVSVNPIDTNLKFKDGNMSRYVLYAINVDDIKGSSGYMHNMLLDRMRSETRRATKSLMEKYPSASIITVKNSQKSGLMRLGKIDLRTYYSNNGLSRSSEDTGLEWLMVDDRYLQKFSPETLEHLKEARRKLM
ncbi:MAG: hypothetical protein V1731_00740 [Candidatus Aenigmatarchaeota archaeon]